MGLPGRDVLGRAHSQCKGPGIRACLLCLRSSGEAYLLGAEWEARGSLEAVTQYSWKWWL